MLKKNYEMIKDAPPALSWDVYAQQSYEEYQTLLKETKNECDFHTFFEQNPSFIPGAFQFFGVSGHSPYTHSLISKPTLNGLFNRVPDFVWLAKNSLYFTPVLIEIENPSKKTFTSSHNQTADFSQALGQIAEWKAILSKPENILQFYQNFAIPNEIRIKTFAPQYLLIYGRRAEFENNQILLNKRAQLTPDDVGLISFDRLRPDPNAANFTCVALANGKYTVKTIPPTFTYSPGTAYNLSIISEFDKAIPSIKGISDERRNFLKERYRYWKNFNSQSRQKMGIIHCADKE